MNIIFGKLEIMNFMSFKEETFDFSDHHGINLICGINNDVPGAKNGAGKCLDKLTLMNVEMEDDVYEKLMQFTCSINKLKKY